jgi:hypothetical protein
MKMVNITNGYGGATAIATIKGAGIGNRHANKRQLAAMAAAILAGDAGFKPSMRQLAQIFGVNVVYIGLAQQFSPAKRKAIIAGEDVTSFTALLNPPKAPLALPAPKFVTDETLKETIRIAGIERTLNAAAAVEAHAA